ncbi:vanadium-dependent haloperoxidase [uncultured Kordia sp.]|uniref:vanadium-dependent haloperoxidase n=1 Tax=uncultured Kordia sp. TaxID=507699 RepID=UPI00260F880F|nr:vanadium-dependent haloperoxidase [uncultured Kordia sp.]
METVNFRIVLLLALPFVFLNSCANDADDIITDTSSENPIIVTDITTQTITEWNDLWLELDRYASGMRPNATSRALAYIHLAAYETAVANMDGYTSNTDRLQGFNINFNRREDDIDLNLALNACYATVMDHFMYNVQADVDSKIAVLQDAKETALSQNLTNEVVQNSIEWGNYVAQRTIAYSQTDTEAEAQIVDPQPSSYEPPVGEGFWTYSADEERAWFPYWASVRTFVISADETSSIPPPISYSEDTTSDFYAEMQEVYTVNNTAKSTNNEQLWIAEFWSDDVENLMMSPPGRQISIANQLIAQYDLDFENSLVLLLKLGFSLNDAAVSTWADKYEYMVMRPSVYIQEFIDPDFQTNLYTFIFWPNPSFPGYPSGHSTFASAAAGVFIDEFGDTIDFTDRSHEGRTEFNGTPRTFDTFTDMAEENAYSRIPLGVHIRMDCTEGLRLGYEISSAVNNYDLSQSTQ